MVEKADGNYSAHAPDLLGYVAVSNTRGQVRRNMREAIELSVRGLREDKLRVPRPHSFAEFVLVV